MSLDPNFKDTTATMRRSDGWSSEEGRLAGTVLQLALLLFSVSVS